MQQNSRVRILPYPLIVLFGLIVGYLALHTDETPFIALPLAGATFVLGFIRPRGAWRWALLTGLWVPLAQLFALLVGMRVPYKNDISDIQGALIGGLLFGFAGAYAGVLGRWLIGQAADGSVGTSRQG